VSRILVIHYSQSGEVERAAEAFVGPLEMEGHEVTFAPISPMATYPFPWRSVRRFFDAMPESVLGVPPEVQPPAFDPAERYDLVILAYPVWFLSPAPAIQGLLQMPHAAVLRDTDVVTLTVCRSMWQRASERMKTLLVAVGARHIDNVVVTHQGSPLATFVSTPRALLFGKRDRLMGIFPEAGASNDDLERVRRLGEVAASALGRDRRPGTSLLEGEPAVRVVRWLIVPELFASYVFVGWASAIRRLGAIHLGLRAIGVYGFAFALVLMILVVLPVTIVGTAIVSPLLRARIESRAARLAAPTGETRS
jgi:hypothetical protein